MIKSLSLWIDFAKTKISERMAYRGEYFISLISMFVLELIGPLFALIIYNNSQGFEGWSFYQILLLQGIFLIVKGFSFFSFFGITWNSIWTLKSGNFDLTLIKPKNPLFLFICQSFDSEDIGKFLGGIFITAIALSNLQDIALINLLLGFFAMILGILFFFSIALFSASFSFLFIGTFRIYEILESLFMIGNYPKSIYPKPVGVFFTTMIPIFMVAFFPANVILGTFTNDILISSLSIFILLGLGLMSWSYSIKKYSSAGG